MKRSSKKKYIIIGGAALAVCILIATILLTAGNASDKRVKELLAVGDRYLSELDYEQAVASYQAVIEIDPRNVDAYLGMAEAYLGADDMEAALAALTKGYELTGDERLAVRLEELQSRQREAKEQADRAAAWDDFNAAVDELCEIPTFSPSIPFYLSDAEREAIFRPYAQKAESLLEQYPEAEILYERASWFYMMLGELDRAHEMRRLGYELQGSEYLNPEGYEYVSEDGAYMSRYDAYGREIYKFWGTKEISYEYNDKNRVSVEIVVNHEENVVPARSETVYVYDAEGKLAEKREVQYYDMEGSLYSSSVESYEYIGGNTMSGKREVTYYWGGDSTYSYSGTLTYDEYGFGWTQVEWIEDVE